MKTASTYRRQVPVAEILDHPDACFARNVLTSSGNTILIPAKVPIRELAQGLQDPHRIVRSLENMGARTVELEFRHEVDPEEVRTLLEQADGAFRVVDPEVSARATATLEDFTRNLTIDQKFVFPRGELDRLGTTLAEEINRTSQILLSLSDPESQGYEQTHAVNVSLLSGYLARRITEFRGLSEGWVEKAVLAGLLFDLGKTRIPQQILSKPDPLSAEEMRIVREHPVHSERIARSSGISDPDVLAGIRSHHERWDGTGYPDGLAGERIPFLARILCVADVFDAMTSRRTYRDAVSSKVSFNFIMSANEKFFDPDVCRALLTGMGIYPPGCVVELSDGTVGTVAASTEGNLVQPRILIREGEGTRILDLAQERLFIRRCLDL